MKKDIAAKKEYVQATFKLFDQDGDDFVTVSELESIFRGCGDNGI